MSILEYDREEELKKLREAEYEIGKAEGKAEALLLILEFRGEMPDWLKGRSLGEIDKLLLESWLRAAADTKTIGEFLEETGLKQD